jgi:urease accessory protein UreH
VKIGLSAMYELEKAPEPPWAAIGAMLIGVAQIVAGAVLLAALSATGVGAVVGAMFARALISEGCSDITIGVAGLITGNFKWSDYKQQKLESLTMTAAFAGFGAAGKSLSLLNRARKAKNLHTQAKQLMSAAKAAKKVAVTAKEGNAAKVLFKQAKQLKSQGNELFKKGRSRVIHKGTDVRGMTSQLDKARHIAKYTAKKIGSAAVTAASHQLINQMMQSLMDKLVKNIMDNANTQIKNDISSSSPDLEKLFGQFFHIKDSDRALQYFFENEKGRSLITSLIQNENPCLSTWDDVSSGFSTLADMHAHSGGSKNTVDLLGSLATIADNLTKGVEFLVSCNQISRETLTKLNGLLSHQPSVKVDNPVNSEQEKKKKDFILNAINQYQAFVTAEVLCAFEHHIIRPMLKKACTKSVKNFINTAHTQIDSMRAETRLKLIAQGEKKMGHQEVSHLLNKEAEYSKLLGTYGMAILQKGGEEHYVAHRDYMQVAGISKKSDQLGLFIEQEHAIPCIQVNGKWEAISLRTTLKNACIPQSLFFAHEFCKAKQQKFSDEEAKQRAIQSACDPVKLANYRSRLVESLQNDNGYRAAYTNRDFRRYREVAKAGAKKDLKAPALHGTNHDTSYIVKMQRKDPNVSELHLETRIKNPAVTPEALLRRTWKHLGTTLVLMPLFKQQNFKEIMQEIKNDGAQLNKRAQKARSTLLNKLAYFKDNMFGNQVISMREAEQVKKLLSEYDERKNTSLGQDVDAALVRAKAILSRGGDNNSSQNHIVSDLSFRSIICEGVHDVLTNAEKENGTLHLLNSSLKTFIDSMYESIGPNHGMLPQMQDMQTKEDNAKSNALNLLSKVSTATKHYTKAQTEEAKSSVMQAAEELARHLASTASKNIIEGNASANSGIQEDFDGSTSGANRDRVLHVNQVFIRFLSELKILHIDNLYPLHIAG